MVGRRDGDFFLQRHRQSDGRGRLGSRAALSGHDWLFSTGNCLCSSRATFLVVHLAFQREHAIHANIEKDSAARDGAWFAPGDRLSGSAPTTETSTPFQGSSMSEFVLTHEVLLTWYCFEALMIYGHHTVHDYGALVPAA